METVLFPPCTHAREGCAAAVSVALLLVAPSVRASSVDVRCPDLPVTETGELQARARLLLSSAGYESARVGVECDASGTWLVWTDGSRITIDVHSGVVEGALDAIESRVSSARDERARAGKEALPPSPEPTPPAGESPDSSGLGQGSREGAAGNKEDDVAKPERDNKTAAVVGARAPLEGGISVGTTTEFWGSTLGIGLRVDVGVGVGDQLAVVIGQGGRLALPKPRDGEITAYDLQAGFAIGAPFRSRTGLGLVLLGGAERLGVSDWGFQSTGYWVWAITGTLGGRASVQVGSVDLWLGADVALRSKTLELKGGADEAVPSLSGSLSLGCLFPAFTHETSASAGTPRQVGATSRRSPGAAGNP
jgi:hypothetical protein